MTVGYQDALESVKRNTLGDIKNKIQQVFHANINGSGKIHLVGLKTIRNQRQQQNLSVGLLRGFFADPANDKVIGIEGQMRPVIFNRSNRKNHHRLFLD